MSTHTPDRTSKAASAGLWRLVAEREITTRLREKSFIVTAAITAVSVAGLIIANSLIGSGPQTLTIGTVGSDAAAAVKAAAAPAQAGPEQSNSEQSNSAQSDPDKAEPEVTFDSSTYDSAEAARAAVRDGDVDLALVPRDGGLVLVSDEGADPSATALLTSAVSAEALQRNASAAGTNAAEILRGTSLTTQELTPAPEDAGIKTGAAFVMLILFFVFALGFGMQIAQSVTQEKESRIVEILASVVPIRSLLVGKVVGNSILVLGQLLILVVVAVGASMATGSGVELRAIGPILPWFVLFFVLGFSAIATLWAVAGSLAARQQDLASTSVPIQTLLFIPYLVAFSGSDRAAEIVSMLPISSMMIMPTRMAQEDVPGWQIAVAVGGTIVAGVLLMRLGATIFERSLLRTGRRLSYREALSLAKG